MHWIFVTAFLAFIAVVFILTWSVWSYSRVRSRAAEAAKKLTDSVTGKARELTNACLDEVRKGADPYQAASDLREESMTLIPGKHGELPSAALVQLLGEAKYRATVNECRRRVLTVMVAGTAAITAVAIVISTVLFQIHTTRDSASPEARPPVTSVEYFEPFMTP